MAVPINGSIVALDIGAKRIGVAIASWAARLPHPLTTLDNNDSFMDRLAGIIDQETVTSLVVGLPRGLSGQSTGQSVAVEAFVDQLAARFSLPIIMQDEALTSVHAEQELASRKAPFHKADIDALAATYILDDYLQQSEVASA